MVVEYDLRVWQPTNLVPLERLSVSEHADDRSHASRADARFNSQAWLQQMVVSSAVG